MARSVRAGNVLLCVAIFRRAPRLFLTDVEGSTRLLDRLGADDYATVLAEHRRVVRDAIAR